MKLKHIALIGSLFPILFSLVLFFGVLISADSDDENSNFSSGKMCIRDSSNAEIIRKGKNWYITIDNCIITINAYSYTAVSYTHLGK